VRRVSPDVWILLQPGTAFRTLAARPPDANRWLTWRRPLFFAFLLGSTMSLTTTGSLTLRLVPSAAVSWAFVPAIEVAALALVLRRDERDGLPRLIDLFCSGFGAWSLWLIAICVMFAVVPPTLVFQVFFWWLEIGAAIVLAWSAYVDYCFFREVVGRNRRSAARTLLVHRC